MKTGSISFKSYFKQIPVPFKISADFECLLKGVKSSSDKNNCLYTEKYQDQYQYQFSLKNIKINISISFAYKVVCVDNKFSKKVVVYRGKDVAYRFIEAILEEYDYCEKNDKKAF